MFIEDVVRPSLLQDNLSRITGMRLPWSYLWNQSGCYR